MTGNDQVRFCEHCNLQVHDLNAMTRQAAMQLVARSQGRLCVRFVQAPDGSPLVAALPQKLHRLGRRVSRIAAGAFSASLGLSGAVAQTRTQSDLKPLTNQPVAERLTPLDTHTSLSGVVTDPNGAVVAGATITLTNPHAQLFHSYTTGDDGKYSFTMLEAGTYILVAEAASFARTEKSEIVVRPNIDTAQNLTMELPQLIAELNIPGALDAEGHAERTVFVTGGVVAFVEPEDPLVKAVFKNDLPTVKELVQAGSDLNVCDRQSNTTPLAEAVERNNPEIVRFLLAAGADVNTRNRSGMTALMSVGESSTAALVKDLLAAGANVNAVDEDERTALLLLAPLGNLEVIKELIRAGADTSVTDNNETTVLMHAASNSDSRVLQLLLSAGRDATTRNAGGKTALMFAVSEGRVANMKLLLAAGIDVDIKDEDGRTALMYAAEREEPEVTKLLLDKGADFNLRDGNERTALSLAASNGSSGTVKLLIAAGSDINTKDDEGWTPLMHAYDQKIIDLLLEAGGDLSLKNNEGRTALALARKEDQADLVKLLLSRGAPE